MNHKFLYQYCAVGLGLCGAIFLSASPVQAQNGSPTSGSMMGSEIVPPPPIAPAPQITPPPVVEPPPVQPPPVVEPPPVQPPPVVEPPPVQPPPVQAPPLEPTQVQPPPITTETPSGPSTSGGSETNPSNGAQGQQGVISTTGDIGGFGSGTGSQTVFAGRGDAQASVNEAGTVVLSQLNVGNLTAATGASLSVEAQQLVAVVLTTGQVNSVNALSTALSSTPGGPSEEATRRLASRLARLLADGQVNAEQLLDAIVSYNEMIMQSNAEFLGNPPPELLAIQISLSRLIEAAGGS